MKEKELKSNEKNVGTNVSACAMEKTISNKTNANIARPTFEEHTTTSSKANPNLISNYQPLISKHQSLNSKFSPLTANSNAITLIALIITIIVMLILVGVTVTIALNGGLFSQAKQATRRTGIGVVKELVYTDIGEKQIENEGDKVTRSQLKDILEQYFKDVPDISSMTDEELGEVKLTVKEEYGGYKDVPLTDIYGGIFSTKQEFLAEEILKNDTSSSNDIERSPYVKYNNMLWRVLYDVDSGYGVQLVIDQTEVTNGKIQPVRLGKCDEELLRYDSNANKLNDLSKGMLSYNNAVDRLNYEASKYLIGGLNDVVDCGRSLGTAPDFSGDPNPDTYWISNKEGEYPLLNRKN